MGEKRIGSPGNGEKRRARKQLTCKIPEQIKMKSNPGPGSLICCKGLDGKQDGMDGKVSYQSAPVGKRLTSDSVRQKPSINEESSKGGKWNSDSVVTLGN